MENVTQCWANLVFASTHVFSLVFSLILGENILVGLRKKHYDSPVFFPQTHLTKHPKSISIGGVNNP